MMNATTDHVAKLLQERNLFGKYRGQVTQVGDGDNLGQIKVTIPTVYGRNVESPWCDPVLPFGGAQHGFAFLPEVKDGVWIEFEGGDVSHPIWSGCFWAKDQIPSGVATDVRMIASSHGHQIVLDDDNDELRLEHGGGPSLVPGRRISITLQVGGQEAGAVERAGSASTTARSRSEMMPGQI